MNSTPLKHPRTLLIPITAIAVVTALAGCTPNNPQTASSTTGGITVAATDTTCALSTQKVSSGTAKITVTNSGTQVTEFELLASDGANIVAEVENVGPGLTRTLSLQAQPGKYTAVCKPGMAGDGVGRSVLQVTGKAVELAGDEKEQTDKAATSYVGFIRDQASTLLVQTKKFATLFADGKTAEAKELYPYARAYYEQIEPVAESFGDLDPELDARQADVTAGQTWTGWHRMEKDLWQPTTAANGGKAYTPMTAAQRQSEADLLVKNTEQLVTKVRASSFTVTADAIGNGSIGLMDEVAKSKITGEEETWSHTDLWDFQANVTGAKVAYSGVRAIAKAKDPALVTSLDARFASLQTLLSKYGSASKGFVSYTTLTQADIKALSDSVNALSEPLSTLTATILK